MEQATLEISWGTILKIIIVCFAFYIVFLIKEILILSLFAFVISMLFDEPIRLLERRISRPLAVVFLYLLVFTGFSLLIYFPATSIISEVRRFIGLFPFYFEQFSPPLRRLGVEAFEDMENFIGALEKIVQGMTINILNVLFSVFGGIASTLFVISVAIFLSLEGKNIENVLVLLISGKDEEFIRSLWRRSQRNVGFWFLKSVIGCIFLGIASYIAFLLLGINYPFSLALIGGSFNFVPFIGPFSAIFLMFIVLALDSWSKAFFAVLIYIILQEIENNIISPLITKKLVGLSPVLVLISLTAGGKLFGILGAVLTVPLMGVIIELTKGFLERKKGIRIRIEDSQSLNNDSEF